MYLDKSLFNSTLRLFHVFYIIVVYESIAAVDEIIFISLINYFQSLSCDHLLIVS